MRTSRRKAIVSFAAAGLSLSNCHAEGAASESGRKGREVVSGIGGFFFRAHDPKKLAQWYEEHLGITLTPGSYTDPVWAQEPGPTVFTPFAEDSDFFERSSQQWLLNFRVGDLEKLARQLEAEGIAVKRDPTTYPNGRFARVHDPEGNPIELWQPAGPAAR